MAYRKQKRERTIPSITKAIENAMRGIWLHGYREGVKYERDRVKALFLKSQTGS